MKTLFVCTFNPLSQEVKYIKTICVTNETKELVDHSKLGTVKVTDEFLNYVRFGVEGANKIFIRRVYPVSLTGPTGYKHEYQVLLM